MSARSVGYFRLDDHDPRASTLAKFVDAMNAATPQGKRLSRAQTIAQGNGSAHGSDAGSA